MKKKKLKMLAQISLIIFLSFFLNGFIKQHTNKKYFVRFDKSYKPLELKITYNDSIQENYSFNNNECLIEYKRDNPISLKVIMKNKRQIVLNNISQDYILKGVHFEKSIVGKNISLVLVYYSNGDHKSVTSGENIKFEKIKKNR